MRGALVVSIVLVALAFLALTAAILAGKGWREIRERRRRARRRSLEPLVLDYAHGREVSILAALGGGVAARDDLVVRSILLDHVQRVRGIERDRLRRAFDELGYVDRFLVALSGPRWWRRAEAAEHLGLAGAARATPRLAAALEDDVAEVRLRAAKALGLVGGRAAVAPLLRALTEPDRWSTIRIADVLSDMGREVIPELQAAFPGLGRSVRLAALDILGRIHSVESVGWLVDRLADEDRDVRARAAHALGSIGAPDAGPPLRDLLSDPEWPVRAMAAKALGRIRDVEAIAPLCAGLRDAEWWVRANAAEALRSLGAPGLEALERMLVDQDPYARHQACLMLEVSGVLDRRVAQLAGGGVGRFEAESVVTKFAATGQTVRLQELAGSHADERVREELARLLGAPAVTEDAR